MSMAKDNPEVLEQLQNSLDKRKDAYESRKHRKYYVLAVGLVIGIIVGYAVPWVVNRVGHATYQRDQLEDIMHEYLGNSNFE